MNKKILAALCLSALTTSFTYAHGNSSSLPMESVVLRTNTGSEASLPLSYRVKEHEHNVGHPVLRSIVLAPEVTMDGHTIHFVTPCDGYELLLVKDGIIAYSVEIDGDTLLIPDALHGTYELQIVTEDYIFYTAVSLP